MQIYHLTYYYTILLQIVVKHMSLNILLITLKMYMHAILQMNYFSVMLDIIANDFYLF